MTDGRRGADEPELPPAEEFDVPPAAPPVEGSKPPKGTKGPKAKSGGSVEARPDPKVADLEKKLADAEAKIAAQEHRLAKVGARKAGAVSWTSKGNHDADIERITKAEGDPRFITKKQLREEYQRFARRTPNQSQFLQPVAAPATGREVVPPKVGRRIDKTAGEV